jgi:beta-lactam-binding protein with PASTA domain
VVGLTQDEAVRRLTDAGFVSVSVATPADASGGVVTDQDPAARTQAGTTTTIKLVVSSP